MKHSQNVHFLDADIHSHALLDIVDEVYLLDDHFGFEALMAKKPVHCFGRPFYAGWGLTVDAHPNLSRKRQRSLEELFFTSYIHYSRYLHPDTGTLTTLDIFLQAINKTKIADKGA